jgi:hypothetical protein
MALLACGGAGWIGSSGANTSHGVMWLSFFPGRIRAERFVVYSYSGRFCLAGHAENGSGEEYGKDTVESVPLSRLGLLIPGDLEF